jgi:hypothetical protein
LINAVCCGADPSLRKKRKKFKGNTGKNFSEGWVEFNDKAVAKRVHFSVPLHQLNIFTKNHTVAQQFSSDPSG